MPNQSTRGAPRLVRLNALTNPPSPAEDRWLAHYGLGLERVEANDPDAILNCAAITLTCAIFYAYTRVNIITYIISIRITLRFTTSICNFKLRTAWIREHHLT